MRTSELRAISLGFRPTLTPLTSTEIHRVFTFVATTFFAYLSRRQFGALRYSAVVEPSYVLEDRLELHVNSDLPVTNLSPKIQDSLLDKDGKSKNGVIPSETSGWSMPIPETARLTLTLTINLISAWDSVLALKLLVRLTSLMAERSRYRPNLH